MGRLRLLLALAVLTDHSGAIFGCTLVGGEIAVKAFYIISGFYMALILKEKYTGKNQSYRLFITNRFLRLYPVYWTILLLSILYSLAVAINSHGIILGGFSSYIKYFGKMSLGSLLYLIFSNIFLFLQDTVMFLGLDVSSGNLFFTTNFKATSPMLFTFLFVRQAWTIGLELTFYIIAPFLVSKSVRVIICLVFLSFSLRLILISIGLKNDPWSYRFFPTELIFFLLGIISYHIYNGIKDVKFGRFGLYSIFGYMILLTVFLRFIPFETHLILYLTSFFICLPFIFLLTKNWKWDRYIGELSYPVYISHLFVLSCLSALKIPVIGGIGFTLALVSILFALLINNFITKRVENLRQKRLTK